MFNKLNILKTFFNNPKKEFNIREIARLLKISPATASTQLKSLAKQGFLKQRNYKHLILCRADLESNKYKDLKTYHTITRLRESGLITALNEFYLKPTIILFGSASRGIDTEASDLDLLIISEKTQNLKEKEKYEHKLKREIQLFPVRKISDLRNKHLINNVLNGIVIQGSIEWASMNALKKGLSEEQK
jgi:predicted nucleotidyltransferase